MYIYVVIANFIFFNLFFLWSVKKNDFSVVDIAWGSSALIQAIVAFYLIDVHHILDWTILMCVMFWSLRLSIYIFMRNRKTGEDYRYRQMRENWKEKAVFTSYWKVFLFQCLLSLIIFSPISLIIFAESKLVSHWSFIGLTIWIIGFVIESIADYQKNSFKMHPSRKSNDVCNIGLWKFSQHPNYFGESFLWFGIAIIGIGSSYFPWMFVGPILITYFLIKFSGIPYLRAKNWHNPLYRDYASKTSLFIPWFPKK